MDLTAGEREWLLGDLTAHAVWLRNAVEGRYIDRLAPTDDQIRAELHHPSGQCLLQPVVWLRTDEVVGFEALTRFPDWGPERWFRRAWEEGLGLELELQAVQRALAAVPALPDHVFVAINVSPLTLRSEGLAAQLAASDPTRIVLELTEHERIGEYGPYRDRLRSLRQMGIRIAVDDAGAGYSSLQHIIQLEPDIIKLDRALTTNCDKDPVRRALMTCLATFAVETHISLVAEGIENAQEAAAVLDYGIDFGQGYHYGLPGPSDAWVAPAVNGRSLAPH